MDSCLFRQIVVEVVVAIVVAIAVVVVAGIVVAVDEYGNICELE